MGRGHGDASGNNPPKAWQQDGDWMCSNTSCTNVNFAFRGVCNHYGSAGPTRACGGDGGRGGDQFIKDRFYDDLNMDEVDLSIENYEELFGEGHNDPKHLFVKDGIDSLFAARDTSVAESACHGAYTAKVS
nr:zinc finger protein CONSTANS-LIKE 9-like [Tanacetum cinerariifolium]